MPVELPSHRVPAQETEAPVFSNSGVCYWRALDGLRGVAVLLVLLAHAHLLPDMYAGVAVNMFFVLSGFLITSILTAEMDRHGDVSIRSFYLRRVLRLLPALMVCLAVFVIISFLFNNQSRAIATLVHGVRALLYWTNWSQIERFSLHNPFNHTWSLSIEEQFYIVWPWLLYLFLKKCSRSSIVCWIALLGFLSMIVRMGIVTMDPTSLGLLRRANLGLDTRADSLLIGSLIGLAFVSGLIPTARGWWRWFWRVASFLSMAGLSWMGHRGWLLNPPQVGYGWTVASIFSGVTILTWCWKREASSIWRLKRCRSSLWAESPTGFTFGIFQSCTG